MMTQFNELHLILNKYLKWNKSHANFGKDRIVNVFADREFIGEKWFTWLIENDINFCIRVKKLYCDQSLSQES